MSLQIYPAPEYAAAIKALLWSEFESGIGSSPGLKTCQQVVSRDGPFPFEDPISDTVPAAFVVSEGWEGDRESAGIPALSGPLKFTIVYFRQFSLEDSEETIAQALDADLRTLALPFCREDWKLTGFTAPSGWRHRRIHPVNIGPRIDEELSEMSVRLVGGEIELRAYGDATPQT